MKRKVKNGEMAYKDAKESYQSWKAHAERGNTYYVLQEMDCYFYSLFINYLSDEEKVRYEKLKTYNEKRKKAKRQKQEVKKNGKTAKKPTERN